MSNDGSKSNKKWIGIGATVVLLTRLGRAINQLSKSDYLDSNIANYIQILISITPAILILIGGIFLLRTPEIHKKWGVTIVIVQVLQIIQSSTFYYIIDKFSYSSPIFKIYQIVGTLSYITFAITILLFFNFLRKNWNSPKTTVEDNNYNYFK